MEHIFVLFVTLFSGSISFTLTSDVTICKDAKGKQACCQDYKNISGKCTACIGFFGKGCSNPCEYGFYGHGCPEHCNCSQNQICDKRKGCLVFHTYFNITKYHKKGSNERSILQSMIITTCGILVLVFVVFGIVCYFRRILKGNGSNTSTDVMESSLSGNTCSVQQEQEECIYNDVRESRMVENTEFVLPENYRMHVESRSKMMKTCISLPKQCRGKLQESTCSSSLDLTNYGGCSDNYSSLQLKKISSCTLPSKFSVNMNDYAFMKPNLPVSHKDINAEKENCCKGGEYGDQTCKENPAIARSGENQSRLFRPYSSVTYHRNVEQE